MLVLKLKVHSVTRHACNVGEKSVSYVLHPVYGDANQPWSKFTPNGKLEFQVTNPDAPELEVGAECYCQLTAVKPVAPTEA